MSVYTTQLRWVLEKAETDAGHSYVPGTWTSASDKMCGLDAYPLFEEAHRRELNDKIYRHYYMREIGLETIGLFCWQMRERMMLRMPYYNELYKSAQMILNPMTDTEISRKAEGKSNEATVRDTDGRTTWDRTEDRDSTANGTSSNDGTNTQSTTSSSESIFSDTPMDMLDNSGDNLIKKGRYATNVTYDDSSTNVNGTTSDKGTTSETRRENETGNGNGTSTENETGKRDETWDRSETEKSRHQSEAKLVMEYRKAIVNIDEMIVNDLADLFLMLY